MSRNAKIILGIVGGLVACCCILVLAFTVLLPRFGAQFMGDMVATDENVGEVARSMVDYNLPAGMQEEMAMNFFGIKTAVFSGSSEESMVMLMQFPSALAGNEEEMRRQMEDSFGQQFSADGHQFQVIGSEEVTINGQPAVLTTSESTGGTVTMRQVVGSFSSKDGGPAMIMAMAPVNQWQQDGLDRFLESIQRGGDGR
ncbi:MAG: hypothetical protein R6X32_02980 [Chloroflexota bacterium]|jgi:hypothetical protein